MTQDDRASRIRAMIAEQLAVPEASCDDAAALVEDLGADSLDCIEMVMALEDDFGIRIDDDDFDGMKTVGDVVRLVGEHAAKAEAAA